MVHHYEYILLGIWQREAGKEVENMDIASMSIVLNQHKVQQQASISVMKKAMDQMEGNTEFIQNMMEQKNIQSLQHMEQPHLGVHIDLKA